MFVAYPPQTEYDTVMFEHGVPLQPRGLGLPSSPRGRRRKTNRSSSNNRAAVAVTAQQNVATIVNTSIDDLLSVRVAILAGPPVIVRAGAPSRFQACSGDLGKSDRVVRTVLVPTLVR